MPRIKPTLWDGLLSPSLSTSAGVSASLSPPLLNFCTETWASVTLLCSALVFGLRPGPAAGGGREALGVGLSVLASQLLRESSPSQPGGPLAPAPDPARGAQGRSGRASLEHLSLLPPPARGVVAPGPVWAAAHTSGFHVMFIWGGRGWKTVVHSALGQQDLACGVSQSHSLLYWAGLGLLSGVGAAHRPPCSSHPPGPAPGVPVAPPQCPLHVVLQCVFSPCQSTSRVFSGSLVVCL